MAFDSARKNIVLFGGASGSNLFADTWTWDGTEWTQVADTGPAARSGRALAYDGARERVVLFGGRTAANPLGDTWEWDGTEWTQVQDVGPSARLAHAMAFDSTASRVVLFGGAGANGAGLNDTWLWDGTAWTQAVDTGPDPRAASALVAATTIVLFGGVNSIDPSFPSANRIIYGDSWRWDGHAWTEVQHIGPGPRWGHGMAFRSDASRIVLVGGSSVFGPAQDASLQAGVMRDTWEHPDQGVAPGPAPGPHDSVPCNNPYTDSYKSSRRGGKWRNHAKRPRASRGRYCEPYEGTIAPTTGLTSGLRYFRCWVASHDTCQHQFRQLQHAS